MKSILEETKLQRQRRVYGGFTLQQLPCIDHAVKYRHHESAPYFNRVCAAVQQALHGRKRRDLE